MCLVFGRCLVCVLAWILTAQTGMFVIFFSSYRHLSGWYFKLGHMTLNFTSMLSHRNPLSAWSLESAFPLQYDLLYFIQDSGSANHHLPSRPYTFWKYIMIHNCILVLEILAVSLCILPFMFSKNVDCSCKLCLSSVSHK